jgi:GEVED domain/SprB repeat/Secretion system C-terminal sorting domain
MKRIFTILTFLIVAIAGKAQPFQFLYTNISNASCGSTADGSACWNLGYGIPPYSFSFTNTADSNNVGCYNNLSAGVYTITVTDFSGSITSTIATIGVNNSKLKIFASDTTLCDGDSITLSPMFTRDGIIAGSNYCTPVIASINNEDITNVTVGTINNTTTCTDRGALGSVVNKYNNYTDIAATITASSILPVSITIGQCNTGVGTSNSTAIFIDYNVDGDFADAGELVYVSPSAFVGAHTETGTIAVPNSLQRGISRMRVVNATGLPSSILSCGSYANGEVEDYTLFFETAPLSIFWETLSGTQIDTTYSLSTSQASTYSLVVDYGNGCLDTASLSVSVNPIPFVSINTNNITCPNASLTANVVTGTGPFNYDWIPTSEITPTITNLTNNTYVCAVIDSFGCVGLGTYIMAVVPPMATSPIINNVKCFGDSTGMASLSLTGGTIPYSYQWLPNVSTTNSLANKPAGNYQVTVTDGNFCTYSTNIIITQPSSDISILISSTNVSGFGLTDGKAKAFAQGGTPGYTYLWAPGGETTDTINNKPAGTYTITITDGNGCSASDIVIISQPISIQELQKMYQLQIAPNPANKEISIIAAVQIQKIELINLQGQVVFEIDNLQTTNYKINCALFANGIYTVRINEIVSNKISIQK